MLEDKPSEPFYLFALYDVLGHRHFNLQVAVVLGPGVVLSHGPVVAVGVCLELLLSPGEGKKRRHAEQIGEGREQESREQGAGQGLGSGTLWARPLGIRGREKAARRPQADTAHTTTGMGPQKGLAGRWALPPETREESGGVIRLISNPRYAPSRREVSFDSGRLRTHATKTSCGAGNQTQICSDNSHGANRRQSCAGGGRCTPSTQPGAVALLVGAQGMSSPRGQPVLTPPHRGARTSSGWGRLPASAVPRGLRKIQGF